MKHDFSAVIRARRNALGMNQSRLAELIGVSRNAVAGWETGHSRPDISTVPTLCEALGITVDMFFGLESPRVAEEDRLLRLFTKLDRRDREAILWQTEALAEGRKRQAAMAESAMKPVRKTREVPVPHFVTVYASDLGAAAGIGAALDEAQGEKIYLLADDETEQADEVITVSGCSMEPTFMDGDRVLVRHTDQLRPGEIGVFLVDNEGYIKEYQPDGLYSHNEAYAPMIFQDGNEVRCIGRVLGRIDDEQWPTEAQIEMLEEMRL